MHMSAHGTLEQKGRAACQGPSVPHSHHVSNHRHFPGTQGSLPMSLATTFYFCKEETTESTSLPFSPIFLQVSKTPAFP